jgi:hypothetical protein
MVPPGGTRNDEPVADLLARLRPEIEQLLASHDLAESEAEEVLHEILFMLIYRWDRIGDRELWLLTALKRSCLRRLQERASRLPEA